MTHANEVGQKVKSAMEAVEEAKLAIADLDLDELEALSSADYEEFEVAILQVFLATIVRRMVGHQLQRPINLMRLSSQRALELLREVEANVGRKKADGSRSSEHRHVRREAFAQFDSRD